MMTFIADQRARSVIKPQTNEPVPEGEGRHNFSQVLAECREYRCRSG